MPDLFSRYIQYHKNVFSVPHGHIDGIGKTWPGFGFYNDLVNHDFNVVYFISIQLESMCDLRDLPVNSHFKVSLFTDLIKKFTIMPFSSFHNRRKNIDGFILVVCQDKIHNLLFGIADHLFPCDIRVSICTSCKKKTHKIINFSDCPYGGSWIPAGGFLLNGDDRA